jgi:DNA-binding response OmpR family regulator
MATHDRILVAEDDEATRHLVARWLSKHHYRILEAADGKRALDLAIAEKPSLVVLDIEMPEMGGLTVIERLRELGSAVPILVLSTRANVFDRVQGLRVGADDYLGKPFSCDELLARVQALLRRKVHVPAREMVLRFGDIAVDLERMVAVQAAHTTRLSRTECSILEVLARSPGVPVTREKLLDVVWGYTYAPETRTVDTHIWRLRKKIGDHGKEPRWIKSIPGAGYLLVVEPREPPPASGSPVGPQTV